MQDKILKIVSLTIDKNKPIVLSFIKNKLGPTSLQALKQDDMMRKLATHIHGYVPFVARIAIREKAFVNFFMNNKERVITLLTPLVAGEVNSGHEQAQTVSNIPQGEEEGKVK